MSTVEPLLKKPKIEYDDVKSENEFNECHNIQQIPNMEIENLFTRAFNSYTVIKQEEFQVIKQNDSDDSGSTQIVKRLRMTFLNLMILKTQHNEEGRSPKQK